MSTQALNDLLIFRSTQKHHNALGNFWAHALNSFQRFLRRAFQRIHGGVHRNQLFSHRFSNVTNAKPKQHARKRPMLTLLNVLRNFAGILFAKNNVTPVFIGSAHRQFCQFSSRKRVVIGHIFQAMNVQKPLDYFASHAIDVHGRAAYPMRQTFPGLSWAINSNAAIRHFVLFANDLVSAARTHFRHHPHRRIRTAQLGARAQNLGNHVARFPHNNGVAHAHIFAVHFVFVMKRCT